MKVVMAQLNPVVGDISGNLARMAETLESCPAEADLVVFPELFLVGYPPRDLLERPAFIRRSQQALEEVSQLSAKYPQTGILVGAPRATRLERGKGLANAAFLFFQGKLLFFQDKSLLPTYDVFDESRYFDPAQEIKTAPFKGEKLGISICEDAWCGLESWCRRYYDWDPVEFLARAGATVLINLSASPYQVGKEEVRYCLIGAQARKYELPFVYVNQVGGNDELIFDGHSLAFDPQGEPQVLLPGFEEAVTLADTGQTGTPGLYVPMEPIAAVHEALVLGLRDYLRKTGFTQAVVGLSGGVDSAVVCSLAVTALGRQNVLGVAMPSQFSSPGSRRDAEQLARNLGVAFRVVPINPIYEAYLQAFRDLFPVDRVDVTLENIQARIRGNILMALSNRFGHLVLATGNKSELSVGYCTLYGDMSGGLSVLGDVPKTMVYELARFINRRQEVIPVSTITKAPSAELRPEQKDQDTLPPYEILDQIIQLYLVEARSCEEIVARGFDPETVGWVIRAIDINEYKRRQAAPVLKVTSKAFGMGRRLPIAAKYEA
uniref:Glutamine-dependent NAD(+) synthetase n=1 Tax=Desulfobacca acetoxidans TaxID=60893 RepID=A0A7C3V5I1_9BACT